MSNEVATTADQQVPDFLRDYDGPMSTDNFDSSDVIIPRIKLLQGLSKECETFEEARPGTFWHTGMDINLGEEVNFVIIRRSKKYLLVAPIDDGQGILARADDAKTWDTKGSWEVQVDKKTRVTWTIDDLDVSASGLDQWGTYDPDDDRSPPAATLFYEYLVLLPDHLELGPCVISLTRSQIKAAKKGLNDKIELHRAAGRPMQGVQFKMRARNDQNNDGQDFKNLTFLNSGFTTKEIFESAIDYDKSLTDYKVQDEGQDEESKGPDTDKF